MIDLAHTAVERICYIQVADAIDSDSFGFVKRSTRRRSSVARKRGIAIARDRADGLGRMIYLADPIPPPLHDEDIFCAVQHYSRRIVNARACGRQALATRYAEAPACNCGDYLSSVVNFTNSAVLTIRDKDVSGAIDCHRGGREETRIEGRAVVAAQCTNSIACDDRHDPTGINFPNDVIRGIGNEYVSGGVQGHTFGAERAFNSRPALRYSSRNCCNNSWKFLGCCWQTGQQHQGKDTYKGLLEKTSAS